MIRVVLDTNIIVSALLQPLGTPAQLFLLALGNSIQSWQCIVDTYNSDIALPPAPEAKK